LVLKRNRLGCNFAIELSKLVKGDEYLNSIDLIGNRIGQFGLKCLLKLGLVENNSVIHFDARLNPGLTNQLRSRFAHCMVRNID
jgi:hypothetical protein